MEKLWQEVPQLLKAYWVPFPWGPVLWQQEWTLILAWQEAASRALEPAHLYLPGPHRGVFNQTALAASPEVVLCESLIDALSFWCHGQWHVTAAHGVEGFTAEHLQAFKEHGVERVLIAYDADAAGDRAAAKLTERLGSEGIECLRVLFGARMDANALVTSVEDPHEPPELPEDLPARP